MRNAVLCLLALALPAPISPALAQMPPTVQELGTPLPQRDPARVYAATCGYCHGTNVGPILLGRHLPADYVAKMARTGRGGMPAFRPSEVTPAELAALAAWISASPRNPAEHGQ